MQQLDERLVRVSIEVDKKLKVYTGLAFRITGTKFTNANQNECEVKITNLDKPTLDYILSETSPFNKNRKSKKLIVEAGRVSYGYFKVYEGNIVMSGLAEQPPDVTASLKCLTGNFNKSKLVSKSGSKKLSLKNLASQVASDTLSSLNFTAKDKNISNYNFTGSSLKEIDELNKYGVNAFLDDDTLVVTDINVPIPNSVRVLNEHNGLIGIPELTELGVKVKFLLDNITKIGGGLRLQSNIYKSLNGDYVIYKLNFEIANRDTPFYWIAEAKRL
jgi:hypothetical protein